MKRSVTGQAGPSPGGAGGPMHDMTNPYQEPPPMAILCGEGFCYQAPAKPLPREFAVLERAYLRPGAAHDNEHANRSDVDTQAN